jgi:hypothetical protein
LNLVLFWIRFFYSSADLDSQNDADPCGSGSGCTTLLGSLLFLFFRKAKMNLRIYSSSLFIVQWLHPGNLYNSKLRTLQRTTEATIKLNF